MTRHLPSTARSLPIALMRARESVMAPIREMLSESGITEQQWRILRVLEEYGQMDSKTLADRASLGLPSLTRIAAKMQEKGLIRQDRDTKDRRRQNIEITAAGQKIIDTHVSRAADISDGFKQKLGAENFETLLDLLAQLDRSS